MSVGTAAKRRFLAPDLARGIALVGIAMANMVTNWDPTDHADHAAGLGGYNGDGTLLEKALVFFETMFVHVRGLPMFATLLGVGMGMIFASLRKRGYPTKAARRVLARRYAFLMLFGIVHLTLFFTNDIMTAYGIAALLLCLAIGWNDTALYILAAAVFVLAGASRVGGIASAFSDPGTTDAAMGAAGAAGAGSAARITDLGARMANGLHNAPFMLFIPCIEVLSFFPLVVIGFVWGRGGVFGDVGSNRRMLTAWAVLAWVVIVGFGIAWGCAEIGALPELVLAERQVKAAVLLQANVEAGLLPQLRGEPAPRLRRPNRPDRIGRHAQALALHPDQREVGARCAFGNIALVEHRDRLAEPAQSPGDGGAEQSAADDGDVIISGHEFSYRPVSLLPASTRSSP